MLSPAVFLLLLTGSKDRFAELAVARDRFDHAEVHGRKVSGGFRVKFFPAGESDRRYVLSNADNDPATWVLIGQSMHGKVAKTDWCVRLERTPAGALPEMGTLAQVLWLKDALSGLKFFHYPGEMRVCPSQVSPTVRRCLAEIKGLVAFSNPRSPMMFIQAWYLDEYGTRGPIEEHYELDFLPIVMAERKALSR